MIVPWIFSHPSSPCLQPGLEGGYTDGEDGRWTVREVGEVDTLIQGFLGLEMTGLMSDGRSLGSCIAPRELVRRMLSWSFRA